MKNIRIYIDKDKHPIYEKLSKRGGENPEDFPFQTMKDVFMAAACLGVKHKAFEPIGASRDIFGADVLDDKTDLPLIAALAYSHDRNLEILNNDREMLDIVQSYANGGISYIQQEIINSPGRPLNNLVTLIIDSHA